MWLNTNKPSLRRSFPYTSRFIFDMSILKSHSVSQLLPSDLVKLLRTALTHHQAGRLAEAEPLYKQVLQQQPRQHDALRLLGVLLRQRGELTDALKLLEEALATQPDSPEAHNDLGLVFFEMKRFDDALASYRRAVELKPEFPEAMHNQGNAHFAQWSLGEAALCFEQALQLNPCLTEPRRSLEWIRANDLGLSDIIEYHRQSLKALPGERGPATVAQDGSQLMCRDIIPHLLNKLGLEGTGVEVGVQQGAFSEQLLRCWKGRLLYSIDPWRELPKTEYTDVANVSQAKQDGLYRSTIKRLMRFEGRSVIWRLTSREAAELVPDQTLDFCYLDGDHSRQAVAEDIRLWYEKLKRGGVLAGHDYIPDGEYAFGVFGVAGAVNEFVQGRHLKLFVSHESKFPSWLFFKA
jgi:tetratricopeptide (TPR) repeat protein